MALGNNAFAQRLVTAQASGSALANSSTATSLLPTAAVYTLPANFFSYIGQTIHIEAYGVISTTSTPTITFSMYLAGASICASQAITTGSGLASVTWKVEMDATVQAVGSGTTAKLAFSGVAFGIAAATSVTLIPATSPGQGTGFNSTQANALDFFGTWGTSSASNTITLTQYFVDSMN